MTQVRRKALQEETIALLHTRGDAREMEEGEGGCGLLRSGGIRIAAATLMPNGLHV